MLLIAKSNPKLIFKLYQVKIITYPTAGEVKHIAYKVQDCDMIRHLVKTKAFSTWKIKVVSQKI